MSFWQNKIVLITGAGSGIGRALSYLLASKGAKLILTDINAENLNETITEISDNVAMSLTADAGSNQQWQYLAHLIDLKFNKLDVLINNAGVLQTDQFEMTSTTDFDWVLNTNLGGTINGVRNMLPLLEKSQRGMIANFSSLFGLVGGARMTAYSTSKFAIRGFSESLRLEFALDNKTIDVCCVTPGAVKTEIINSSRSKHMNTKELSTIFNKNTLITPRKAARVIERGLRKRRARILIGPDIKFVDLLQRIFPRHYYKIFSLIFFPKKIYAKK